MQKFCRVAIIDRSLLAHNIYETILKPHGYSLFFFTTLRELIDTKPSLFQLILINTNIGDDLEALPLLPSVGQILFCEEKEQQTFSWFAKEPQHFLMVRPFHPSLLLQTMQELLGEKNEDVRGTTKRKKIATAENMPN